MGVLGLWRLLDSTGKPVPLETLEGKVLAIDISIWIHQVIQGYQDRQGNSLPNAHLIGLFNRICKLMYFKIKPVFVFDGGVPLLKKNTITVRRKLKSVATSKAHKLKNDLINNLIKHAAVKGVLDKRNNDGESIANSQSKDSKIIAGSVDIDDMYKLPDIPNIGESIDSDDYIDSDDEHQLNVSPRKQIKWMGNIHNVEINNEEFKNLPADVRYDILTDLKETRKQNSWGRIHELPVGSNNYSGFQVKRLLKRRYVQESLEVAEKEMGGKTLTLEELDKLLTDQGIKTTQQDDVYRIASDSKTRVIYMKDLDKCAAQNSNKLSDSNDSNIDEINEQNTDSREGCTDSISIKSNNSEAIIDNMHAYDLEDWFSDDSFSETKLNDSHLLPNSIIPKTAMNPALAYMLEHSGLTRDQIEKIVEQSKKNKKLSDDNSSQASSKKGKMQKNLSLRNKIKKRKLFDSIKIKTENLTDVKSNSKSDFVENLEKLMNSSKEISNISDKKLTLETSESESNDFEEVSEKNAVNNKEIKSNNSNKSMESSDSECNDFIEIKEVPIPELIDSKILTNTFQITIKADEELEDDIFADVFCNNINTPISKDSKSTMNEIQENIPNTFVNLTKKENLSNFEDEKVKLFFENEKNTYYSITSDKIQRQYSQETIDKCNQGIEIKNLHKNSLNSESSTKSVITNDVLIKTEVNEKKNETSDIEAYKNNNKDSVIDNFVINFKEQTTSNKHQEKINEEILELPQKTLDPVLPRDEATLESMMKQLENDQQQISSSLGKLERQATDITDQMRSEAQELLKLFGIPYIIAPMEAEAQCAYLEQIKLTDGTITDDSDIWLFGGQCVYKNFFDNNKKVLQFLSDDIKHHFKLSRKELIQLALLVGSDYTNGLVGVGPVTALEILAAFPSDGEDILRGLRAFSTWFRAGKLSAPGKPSLRNKLKHVQIEKGFPNQAVVQAYIAPMIDESKEAFTWGKPNLILLADYVKKKFGWTKFKFEEIITPVMNKLIENKNQKSIDAYFKVHVVPKSIEASLSKRVLMAVQKIGSKNEDVELMDDEASASSSKKLKKSLKITQKNKKNFKERPEDLMTIIETNEDEKIKWISENANEKNNDDNVKITPKNIVSIVEDIIPQREQDKANALKSKLKAIEIYRKSKKGLDKIKKRKKIIQKIKEQAELSESDSSS